MGQLVRLPGRDPEGNGPAACVRDHDGLGAKAAARAPKRLTFSAASARSPFLDPPAALACALMFVPSRKAIPSSTPRSCARLSRRSQTPNLAQRMKICAAFHHGPSSSGTARHFAPFWQRQRMASTVRLRSEGGTFARGRQASTKGSSIAHCTSVSTIMPQPSAARAKVGPTLRR